MWEDARQDLGLQVLGHPVPRVSADGHQHVAGHVLVHLFQLLCRGGGKQWEWVLVQRSGASHTWSASVGRAAIVNPFIG